MNLFINYYIDPNPERQKEIEHCLLKNQENEKLQIYILEGRPTFKDFFAEINKVSKPDDINIIINSDIYLPNDFDVSMIKHNQCFALTRWDILPDGSEKFYNSPDSQDTWVFRGPIKQVKGADYTQGVPGCDNKLAWELQRAGYQVLNPSLSIKTYHLHNSGIRHYNKIQPGKKDIYRIPGPRIKVEITSLPAVKKQGMTLLNFGLFKPQEPQQSLRDALKGICVNYVEHSFAANPDNARKDFHKLMADHQPDVVFMQIQHPNIIKASTLVRYPGVKFFNFSGDVREIFPSWYFELGPYCTTLFTNTDWVDLMVKKGFKARYFQVGFDHNIYKPDGPKAETKPVVFMGNNHSGFSLSKLREEMVERFSTKEWFQVYGRGWKNGIDLNYKQQEEAAVYRGAKIAINLSNMDLGSYTSDRMFRIMGSGCFCLAYKHKDIGKEFYSAKDLITWETLDELENWINYFMNHEDRSGIAKAGCEWVHLFYTWKARIDRDLKPLL